MKVATRNVSIYADLSVKDFLPLCHITLSLQAYAEATNVFHEISISTEPITCLHPSCMTIPLPLMNACPAIPTSDHLPNHFPNLTLVKSSLVITEKGDIIQTDLIMKLSENAQIRNTEINRNLLFMMSFNRLTGNPIGPSSPFSPFEP